MCASAWAWAGAAVNASAKKHVSAVSSDKAADLTIFIGGLPELQTREGSRWNPRNLTRPGM
jgi:hypothetical protein